jgi:hypothetical protein
MKAEYEVKTNCGHTVKCEAWKSGVRINFTLYVDGEERDFGTTIDYSGKENSETEAEFQARSLAREIEEGATE